MQSEFRNDGQTAADNLERALSSDDDDHNATSDDDEYVEVDESDHTDEVLGSSCYTFSNDSHHLNNDDDPNRKNSFDIKLTSVNDVR